ncbi:MAG: hypothetical protein Q8Q28_11415, partial [Pseudomonadota bacterium]|nr:hypothetical protein [Pseudomonadota bacterium]
MRLKPLPTALLAAGLLSLSPLAGAARADALGLGNLGTSASGYGYSTASALNGAGQVAGTSYYYVGGVSQGSRAFLWSGGAMSNLGSLGTSASGVGYSTASRLNGAGQVAGTSHYYDDGGSYQGPRAFLWSGGAMSNLGSLGTSAGGYGYSAAGALNGAGQVAGYSDYYVGGAYQGQRAFLWSGGAMSNLGSLGTTASGYGYSTAGALNGAGQVAGTSDYYVGGASQGSRAFLWSGGVMNNLGTLGGSHSTASTLNDSGQVVGYSYIAGNAAQHAFLYNAGTMFDLSALAPAGWTFHSASAINAWAQVAGYGMHNGNTEAFLVTLHPDWQGGNGSWSDASRWNFTGMGSFGITPGAPHDVLINPAGSATVYGPGEATIKSLAVSG